MQEKKAVALFRIGDKKMTKEERIKYLKEVIEICDNIEDYNIEAILLARKMRNEKLKELEELENE